MILSLGGKCGSSYGHAWIKGEDVSDSKIKMVMEISSCSKPLAIAQEKEEAIRNAAQTVLKDCIASKLGRCRYRLDSGNKYRSISGSRDGICIY